MSVSPAAHRPLVALKKARLPERPYRLITLATIVSIVGLIGSGGWVRLSESGLGCPTWPKCYHHQLAAHDSYHALTEFVNRCMITAVGILVAAAFIGALIRVSRRKDLIWLAAGLIAGYIGEAVLGGITVLLKLNPALVAAHLVLAMAVLILSVHLHWRAGDGRSREAARAAAAAAKPSSGPALQMKLLVRLTLAAVTLIVILGTVATGAGPRAGSPDTPRFHIAFHGAVAFHAAAGMFLFGLLIASFFMLRALNASSGARKAHLCAVAGVIAQGIVGVIQYYTHLATGLVELHIVGAALIVLALARFNLMLGPPRALQAPEPAALAERRLSLA